MGEVAGVDLPEQALEIRTMKDFLDPSVGAVTDTVATGSRNLPAMQGGVSAGKIVGDLMGGGFVGRTAGGMVGGGLGVLGMGPWGTLKKIQADNYVRRLKNRSPVDANQVFNVWENMNKGNE
jgi:hypothetical protein